MLRNSARILIFFCPLLMTMGASDPAYTPLWQYQGAWRVTRSGSGPGQAPYEVTNECALVGKYFTCQQSVNGKAGGLRVIIPTGEPGRYYTQTIMPEGRATGRDDLEIAGSQWTYKSRRQEGSRTTQYRTINIFKDKNHIHFEEAESTDGKQWRVTNSGDEVRISARTRSH